MSANGSPSVDNSQSSTPITAPVPRDSDGVAQVKVAVHQRQLTLLGGGGDQATGQVVELGQFAGLRPLPLAGHRLS